MAAGSKRPDNSLVLMGRIGAAHGIKGEVRILPFTENPASLPAYSPFETKKPGLAVTVTSGRVAKNMFIARIAGVTDRDAAEKLNGVELFVPRDRLPDIGDEDDFYIADLIGLQVRLEDGTVFGTVRDVPNYGAGDMLDIMLPTGKSELFPFTRAVVPQIDFGAGYLVLVPPGEVIVAGEED